MTTWATPISYDYAYRINNTHTHTHSYMQDHLGNTNLFFFL